MRVSVGNFAGLAKPTARIPDAMERPLPEFMYVQFWKKEDAASTAADLVQLQSEGILHSFPNASITVEQLDLGEGKKGCIRTVGNAYQWLEITGSVEFDKFILFIVLHCREIVAKRNRRKLEYVLRKAVPFSIKHGKAGNA